MTESRGRPSLFWPLRSPGFISGYLEVLKGFCVWLFVKCICCLGALEAAQLQTCPRAYLVPMSWGDCGTYCTLRASGFWEPVTMSHALKDHTTNIVMGKKQDPEDEVRKALIYTLKLLFIYSNNQTALGNILIWSARWTLFKGTTVNIHLVLVPFLSFLVISFQRSLGTTVNIWISKWLNICWGDHLWHYMKMSQWFSRHLCQWINLSLKLPINTSNILWGEVKSYHEVRANINSSPINSILLSSHQRSSVSLDWVEELCVFLKWTWDL